MSADFAAGKAAFDRAKAARERRQKLQREVIASIIDTMIAAQDEGRDPARAARQAFPGVPDIVLIEAELELEHRAIEAWWETLEKTIDGEVLKRAIADVGKGGAR